MAPSSWCVYVEIAGLLVYVRESGKDVAVTSRSLVTDVSTWLTGGASKVVPGAEEAGSGHALLAP